MRVASHLAQSQRQSLGIRQIQGIGLLRLSNEDLAADLARRAAANPFLRLHLPAASAQAGAEEPGARDSSLYAHVLDQIRMIAPARDDEPLAIAFVEALDANGWLDRPLRDIAAGARRPIEAAVAMLDALQRGVAPTGLFARDLADCLRLQAVERGQLTPVMEAVLSHLDLFATSGADGVSRATGLAGDEVARCLARIRRMDPRPGLAFGGTPAPLREPDVIVSRGPDGWRVALNRATLPVLGLTGIDAAGPGMRTLRAEAEWLANIVERRNHTILAVARAVLNRQRAFLDHGPAALLSLSRVAIAAQLGLHDSTVGRAARDLLVDTPHGLRTLCSLFSGGPSGDNAQASASASAIRHRLRQIVAAEDPRRPLDDAALAAALGAEGKPLSRRTVAKYRDQMGIANRRLRRRSAT